jgi:hypothetical protein
MNLKLILMELGNRLVTEYGANPQEDPRCVAIQKMMEMLNDSLEARLILEDLKVSWPVVDAEYLGRYVFEDDEKKTVLKLGTETKTIDLAEADKCEPSEDDWKEETL